MGRREMCTGFWWGNLMETDHLEDLGLDGKVILRFILKEIGWEGMNWIDLAKDRDKWWAVVNVVMKLQVS
jgi:hypothetical protein